VIIGIVEANKISSGKLHIFATISGKIYRFNSFAHYHVMKSKTFGSPGICFNMLLVYLASSFDVAIPICLFNLEVSIGAMNASIQTGDVNMKGYVVATRNQVMPETFSSRVLALQRGIGIKQIFEAADKMHGKGMKGKGNVRSKFNEKLYFVGGKESSRKSKKRKVNSKMMNGSASKKGKGIKGTFNGKGIGNGQEDGKVYPCDDDDDNDKSRM
jgi:hypothetical protein